MEGINPGMSRETGARRADAALRAEARTGRALLWLWGYAAVAGVLAIGVGSAVANATRMALPGTPTRLVTTVAVVVAAGLACERVLASIAGAIRRQ